MDHCAIDIGGKKSQICVRDSDGTIRFEGVWETPALGDHLREMPHCRVILETAAESFRVADQARAVGHEFESYRRRWCERWEWGHGGLRPTSAMLECSAKCRHVSIFPRCIYPPRAHANGRRWLVSTMRW
jgi:hypothetical protein